MKDLNAKVIIDKIDYDELSECYNKLKEGSVVSFFMRGNLSGQTVNRTFFSQDEALIEAKKINEELEERFRKYQDMWETSEHLRVEEEYENMKKLENQLDYFKRMSLIELVIWFFKNKKSK
jgi:uncharacterized membrane protein YgaE (UPF0421/DUF939 family)